LVVVFLVHPFASITLKVYTPVIAVVAFADTLGLCSAETNPFGPVQEYIVIPAGFPVRFKGVPSHTGLLLAATGEGSGLTVTVVLAEPEHPLLSVTV
jgi:hypothetical protein